MGPVGYGASLSVVNAGTAFLNCCGTSYKLANDKLGRILYKDPVPLKSKLFTSQGQLLILEKK
ncbi:unnamed protein product [Prunus armeniaca]